ncbi:helix-turn-helix transcriptional regulator [Thioclava pacifica]|nr:AlpA family phage regulatory protein [Thioclava pacifica]
MSNPDQLMSSGQVREIFGGLSRAALYRWENDDRLEFPKAIVIGNRKFFRKNEIVEFQQKRAGIKTVRCSSTDGDGGDA